MFSHLLEQHDMTSNDTGHKCNDIFMKEISFCEIFGIY